MVLYQTVVVYENVLVFRKDILKCLWLEEQSSLPIQRLTWIYKESGKTLVSKVFVEFLVVWQLFCQKRKDFQNEKTFRMSFYSWLN